MNAGAIGVNAGAIDVKRAGFGSTLEQRETVHQDGWNVATSQRRDVPTSRRPNVAMLGQLYKEVNKQQRRDVPTLRRQREFCPLIIKSKKRAQNWGHRESYEPRRGNQSSSDIDLEEEPVICIFLCFG